MDHLVRFPALPPLLMRSNCSTTFLVDAGLGNPVRSSARQGFAYQLPSVRQFRFPMTSQSPVILTHHQSPTDSAAPILFWKNPIQYAKHLITPYNTAQTGRFSALQRISDTRPWILRGPIDSSTDSGIYCSRGLARWDAGLDIRETRSVDKLLPVDRRVSPYLTLSVTQSSHFVTTLVSIDLDINLPVFTCGTSSIGEDPLPGSKIKRLLGLAPLASNRASWHIFLPNWANHLERWSFAFVLCFDD
jgi:hypothetical protein